MEEDAALVLLRGTELEVRAVETLALSDETPVLRGIDSVETVELAGRIVLAEVTEPGAVGRTAVPEEAVPTGVVLSELPVELRKGGIADGAEGLELSFVVVPMLVSVALG